MSVEKSILTRFGRGWPPISYEKEDVDRVQSELVTAGLSLDEIQIAPLLAKFRSFVQLPEYEGPYRFYGGKTGTSFLEKALEHFLSFELAQPAAGLTFVDVGSCMSVVPGILRRRYNCICYEQDLEYPPGINGWKIGSNASSIPLPDHSVDRILLHCTFEHFEGHADSEFVRECGRLLKPAGSCIILPLYLCGRWVNVSGEENEAGLDRITFDPEAEVWTIVPEWQNRFGRHYSVAAFTERVAKPALAADLSIRLIRVMDFACLDPDLWLRWILILTKT